MKIESFDESLLFSETSIPDVFFTEYLPSIQNGEYVKIYLYLYFISKYNKDIKINDLAKRLELQLKTIQDGLKYLEDKGLILRKSQGYEVVNLQERELNKVYKPKVNLSSDDIERISQNKNRINAIETINNEFFSRSYESIMVW